MSRSHQDDKKRAHLGRRKFLRIGGLGAAAIAAGAARPVAATGQTAETEQAGQTTAAQTPPAQGQAPQAPPAPRPPSPFKRNFDPVPASEPSMNFAAFTDTHVGQSYRSPNWDYAQHLDKLADDIMERTLPCDFVVHLGDGAFNATAFVNGVGLPDNLKGSYKNNFKAYLLSHLNLPLHYVGGNIDLTDYSHGPGLPGHDNDPFVLMKTYINETELNNYPYAFMRSGILFLAVPEMDAEPWTRPATCEWLEFMTTHYHDATTIILSHQAIEDTTPADGAQDSYRGQQDQAWWASLFQRNPQIKMFLHGHNHMAGWYQGSESSGFSRPVQQFGHEMVFASPFPGMSWITDYNLVDATVIFTISSRFITSKAWKQDGTRGKWWAGFDNTWVVPTSFDPKAEDWYSFPFLIQDGETQQTDMKVLSANTALQLVGTGPVELFYDPKFETKGIHTNENILGFDDDLTSKVIANTPGMTVKGPHTITFPPKHEWDRYCHDGHGGPPYRMFAVGTTPAAAPGGSYTVTMKAKSKSGSGTFRLTMSCSDWGTKSQYSTLAGSSREVISHTFGIKEETVTGIYTAPNDDNAWFIQGVLEFADATDFDVSFFSIRRTQTSDVTEDFQIALNGKSYAAPGKLARFKTKDFPISPVDLADQDGVIRLKAAIRGNHYGMARLIYRGPLLMGRNARYKVNAVEGKTFDITLTTKLSGFESVFKMFPFSTKYGSVEIGTAGAEHHASANRNQWITSDIGTAGKRLTITYPK
ncbi:MAG TPA: metallophosphoesterase [Vicinamibacterales bacterium]|nr:metallophosphoesterase [Vicinamibacterales bacterium]